MKPQDLYPLVIGDFHLLPEQLPSILEYLLHCQQGLEKICIEQGWKDTKEFERLLKIDVEVNELREAMSEGHRDYLRGIIND